MKRLPRKRSTLLLSLFVIAVVLFLLRSTGAFNSLQSAALAFTSPITQRFYSLGTSVSNFFGRPTNIAELQSENEQLRDEVIDLKLQVSNLQQAEQENRSLRQLLNFFEDDATSLPKAVARIVGKDPENPAILLLNVGLRDGIEKNNAVVVEDGIIIAKVTEVFARSSKALLLTDTQSQVAATINGGSPTSKIAQGERGLSLLLDQIQQGEVLTQGQLVITSGLEPTIPKGLLIGEIEEIISEENDLFQRAILRPLADANTHSFVSVILTNAE